MTWVTSDSIALANLEDELRRCQYQLADLDRTEPWSEQGRRHRAELRADIQELTEQINDLSAKLEEAA